MNQSELDRTITKILIKRHFSIQKSQNPQVPALSQRGFEPLAYRLRIQHTIS